MKSSLCRIRASRRGAIAILVVAMIAMLLILAAFAINVAYMQLVREQLRVACDSAAKAALVNLGATQDESAAIAFGQSVANRNLVAGQAPQIAASNIVFGHAAADSNGVYDFTAGLKPLNAAQVTGSVTRPLFLQTFLPVSDFSASKVSLTTRISHDICLVLDRSASMAFDLSSGEFSYPADVSAGKNPLQIYFTPPSSTASRWQALTVAVDSFISTLQARNLDVHVALATYAESFSFGTYGATDASLDIPLTSTFSQIVTGMNAWGQQPLLGNTNIEAGLSMAVTELTGPRARPTADRTIILLTDGVPTTGNTDIASLTLNDRQNSQIVTHVITFGGEASSGSYQTMMMNAASNGNGQFFNAPTAAQLQQAFQTIADGLPAVLIK
ncbi:MAG TPA: VWA domain-containing protein [Pirellulales bacterium]|nr:VWA domain-containing protein [Pirellulales bacterium]